MSTSIVTSLESALALVPPGVSTLALGGNSIHRVPLAFVRSLALREDIQLHLVKTAGSYDIDLLCLAERVLSVSAGFIGYENLFGLAKHYRRAVESGRVEAREHACYTVIAALRAAAYGLGCMPVRGLEGSDLVGKRGFSLLDNPYQGGDLMPLIPAIRPDTAVLHVHYADPLGNGVILGPKNEDLLIARSARRVILTAEQVVPTEQLPVPITHVDIPSVLVTAVVELPQGAWPGTCYARYDYDGSAIEALLNLENRQGLVAYIEGLRKEGRL